MEPAIHIQNLTKRYKFRTASPYISLRDVVSNLFSGEKKQNQDFFALSDVNLKVMPGERVAVIGSNGAGKSTLLKILSRITPPTNGNVSINGRVASLLEVGTGFHPELSGRENIYLNGSILGLKMSEIEEKIEEIIEFSGIRPFIDMPLKQFSSGMQLRLAFSVAAHLEPEILLIDEVLAVGDLEFQNKCLGKMEQVSKQNNRTILFVSHNLAAVSRLCTRGIVLQHGKMVYDGPIKNAINFYTGQFIANVELVDHAEYNLTNHPNKEKPGEGLIKASIYVNDIRTDKFKPGSTLKIQLEYFLSFDLIDAELGIVIKDQDQNALIGLNNKHFGKKLQLLTGKASSISIVIPGLNLYAPGKYSVNLYFGDSHQFYECLYDSFQFIVEESDVYGSGTLLEAEWNKIYVPQIDII
jgi:lipopolysaccharide transport system ATP-binding protein